MSEREKPAAGGALGFPGGARRRAWGLAASRIALVAGVFSLLLGGLLLFNSVRLYRGGSDGKFRLVEGRELVPLKAALREDPKNRQLKQKIRELDLDLRRKFFRRKRLAERGGHLLLGGTVVFLISLQAAILLKRPRFHVPGLSARPEDPDKATARAARAVVGTSLALAGLAVAYVWGSQRRWEDVVQASPSSVPGAAPDGTGAAPGPDSPALDPDWFPPSEELAVNWPQFRGPGGRGIATFPDIPDTWDGKSGKNILWKTEIPLPGENSAVVWGDRIFLTGATDKLREVYCLDAGSGALLWRGEVATPQGTRAEPPEVMEETGFAASTGVTDGRRFVAMFANGEIAGFDRDGNRLWVRHLGVPKNTYGHAASLALWRNRAIVVYDQGEAEDGLSRIMALDMATGRTVWSTPRPVPNSWVSPIVIETPGGEQVVTSADPWVIAYNPESGKEIWRAELMSGDVAPSPAYADGLLFVANDGAVAAALRVDGTGNVTESKLVWQWDDGSLPDLCSLLCDGPRMYMLVYGVLLAFDAKTGKLLWEHETEEEFQASPLIVNGRIHMLTSKGVMIMGKAGNEGFQESGRAALGERCGASPAFARGRIFIRGKKHLYCIGNAD